MKMLLAIAAQRGFAVNHFDVCTAYLNSPLEEQIYMIQPPGFESGEPGQVYRLHKSIYGLKQSARNWNKCLNEALESMGFESSIADSCLYIKGLGDKQELTLAFVDDLIYVAKTQDQVVKFAQCLEKHFRLKNLGPVQNYLGVQIERTVDGSFLLNQSSKIDQLLEYYRMVDCKEASTPMEVGFLKDSQSEENSKFESPEIYQSAIGSLLYLSQWSRPDLAYAVGLLYKEIAKPSQNAWVAVKRIFQYLKQTKNFSLKLSSIGTEKNLSTDDVVTTDREGVLG